MLRALRFAPAFLSVCLAACASAGGSEVQGGWTEGTEGRLRFAFDLDPGQQSLSPGTEVDVQIEGPGADAAIDVISSDASVVTSDVRRYCTCSGEVNGSYTVRSIAPRHSCTHSEVKRCDNLVSVSAHAVGDTELVVLDAEGEVLDRAPVKVR